MKKNILTNRNTLQYHLLFICIFITSVFLFAGFQGDAKTLESIIKNDPQSLSLIKEEDFLHADGKDIVNQNGEKILLKGINLGGWLLQEYWMCPVTLGEEVSSFTYIEVIEKLQHRFGKMLTNKAIHQYEDNWITEEDFAYIAELGFNMVRVPFWYLNFYEDEEGHFITKDIEDNPGIQKFDWIIDMAGKYGLYVIFDMHGCPGGQTDDHTAGLRRECRLYEDEHCQQLMEDLWVLIAERYKDSPVVAAYDIMNEPVEVSDPEDGHDLRNDIYDRMYKAIRKVDQRHMITMEAMWQLALLPTPEDAGWENVIYQVHSYGDTDKTGYLNRVSAYGEEHQVPMYIGEFSDSDYWYLLDDYDIHYSSWSYKGNQYVDTQWFIVYGTSTPVVNAKRDNIFSIMSKWGEKIQTSHFVKNEDLINIITQGNNTISGE